MARAKSVILAALFLLLGAPALAQFTGGQSAGTVIAVCGALPTGYVSNTVRAVTLDVNGNLCITGSITATVAFPTIGAAVPASGVYNGINVAGTLRGLTGVNSSGSIYAAQTDLASVAGATVATGHGTAAGSLRVELPTDGTGVVALAAGAAIIGKFGIDQTTPGTTNGVAFVGVNGATALAGNGATGTGSVRVTLANDNTLPSGWASSTAANQTATQAPVAPATATATKSDLVGCQATTSAVNPTTGQQGACSSDTNNNILVSAGGAPNLAISQISVTTSDTAVVSARALRRAVTIQQITGTQNVFCNQTTATAANGLVLPAVVGASITLNTTSAVRCIAITGAQTVAVAETY